MYSPVLSVPARRTSGWVAETDPRYARAWLDSLPLANTAEAAREIYQALYTINRLELRAQARLDLLTLYEPALATISAALHARLAHASPPLTQNKRQLAEFIRRLHVEMAYGYKCGLRDVSRARLMLGRKSRCTHCIERALTHLSEVLYRSYLVYIPCPPGVWREIHELYRVAESLGVAEQTFVAGDLDPPAATTIAERYLQTLLLGLSNPYHFPHNGAQQARAFLRKHGNEARLLPVSVGESPDPYFMVDLATDAPALSYADAPVVAGEMRRRINVRPLTGRLQDLVRRMESGEVINTSDLGIDCLDSACVDLLRRLRRAWSNSARRRFARQPSNGRVFVCVGLPALHYFANGQRPFAMHRLRSPVAQPAVVNAEETPDVAFVELDEAGAAPTAPISDGDDDLSYVAVESHQVDRWMLRDVGPQGMSLVRCGEAGAPLRVGDLLGVQQPNDVGRWRATVVRWIKSPETGSVEVGVEVLAAAVTPIAVRANAAAFRHGTWCSGLRLPAVELARRPSTLLLARGVCRVGDDIGLIEEDGASRQVRVLRLLERTGSFEQIVFAKIVRD